MIFLFSFNIIHIFAPSNPSNGSRQQRWKWWENQVFYSSGLTAMQTHWKNDSPLEWTINVMSARKNRKWCLHIQKDLKFKPNLHHFLIVVTFEINQTNTENTYDIIFLNNTYEIMNWFRPFFISKCKIEPYAIILLKEHFLEIKMKWNNHTLVSTGLTYIDHLIYPNFVSNNEIIVKIHLPDYSAK